MPATVTLDDLIALNDEMLALVRAGVPLGQGLAEVGHDVRGSLARTTATLAARLERGESLPQALAATGGLFPPLYRAIVEAGIKSGRLSAALETTSALMRRMADLRRLVLLAMVYPLIVFFVGYGLFMLFVLKILPTLLSASPTPHPPAIVRTLAGLHNGVEWWGPILPTIVLTAAILWWLRSRQALVLQSGGAARVFGWTPSFRKLLAESRAASFADMLALLVEHQTPLGEAVVLAAEATGDPRLTLAAKQLAADISAGAAPKGTVPFCSADSAKGDSPLAEIPPLLRWLIATGGSQATFAAALRDAADTYRRRAIRRADWLRLYLPMLLTLGIGGTVVVLYALSLFVPWTSMLYQLTQP
jgi:general secretion pathway protein F